MPPLDRPRCIERPRKPTFASSGRWTAAERARSTRAFGFDHMLELMAKHGFFDLTVQAKVISTSMNTIQWKMSGLSWARRFIRP